MDRTALPCALRPRQTSEWGWRCPQQGERLLMIIISYFTLHSGANAGLDKARDFLEPIKQKFPQITYSDLWVSRCCESRFVNSVY